MPKSEIAKAFEELEKRLKKNERKLRQAQAEADKLTGRVKVEAAVKRAAYMHKVRYEKELKPKGGKE